MARAGLAEIEIDTRVVAHLFEKSGASVRSPLKAFREVEEITMASGLKRIGLPEWMQLTGEKAEPERRAIAGPKKAIEAAGQSLYRPAFKEASKVA
jgi:hypothetical protein